MYYSENALKNKRKIIRCIKHRKYYKDAFIITIPLNESNILDILPAKELMLPHYKHASLDIVGIATTKDEAIDLAVSIIQNMYNDTKAFRIREYIKLS